MSHCCSFFVKPTAYLIGKILLPVVVLVLWKLSCLGEPVSPGNVAAVPAIAGFSATGQHNGNIKTKPDGAAATLLTGTLASDFFRSNTANGNWNDAASWESSHDNFTWSAADQVPTELASTIQIRAGHTMNITSNVTLNELIVDGVLELQSGSMTLINNGGDDIAITSTGVLRITNNAAYNTAVILAGNPSINIAAGGKIVAGNGAPIGAGYEAFTSNPRNTWNTNAVFEWNSISTPAAGSYFQNETAIPIFRITTSPAIAPGGAFSINGLTEINANVSFEGGSGSDLNFRDGIIGTATLALPAGLGGVSITARNAVLGGANLTLLLGTQLNLMDTVIVPAGANVSISGASTAGIEKAANRQLRVDGTIDFANRPISNASGSIVINGTFKTSHASGFYNPGNIAGGTILLNTGSTIEYNGATAQNITGSAALGQHYDHIVFSGGSVKTPADLIGINPTGSVRITGAGTVVDASFNDIGLTAANTTGFTMDDGLLILGSPGVLPLMAGAYNLTGGIIRFAGSSQSIRSKDYQHIEVSGADVADAGDTIHINSSGSFTVKTGGRFTSINSNGAIAGPTGHQTLTVENNGIFRCALEAGFYGVSNASVQHNIETINLDLGSTVAYARQSGVLPASASSGYQAISVPVSNGLPIAYQHLVISGDSIKKAPADTLAIKGDFVRSASAVFAPNDGLVLLNGTEQHFAGVDYSRLELSGGIKTTAGGRTTIDSLLQIDGSAILSISNNDSISLLSTAARTARVAALLHGSPPDAIRYGNAGSKFIVHRYIRSGRKWRLLSIPTANALQTFKSSWQEGAIGVADNPYPGYGTIIGNNHSGTVGNDFDIYTIGGPTVKYLNAAATAYTGIPSTNTPIEGMGLGSCPAFFGFILGDRSVTTVASTSSTILRTSGKLFINPAAVSITGSALKAIGNPLASPVDMIALLNPASGTGLVRGYMVWDPQATGNFGLGRWQAMAWDGTNFIVTPGGGSYDTAGSVHNSIEAGIGFLVRGDGTTGASIDFSEMVKGTAATQVSFTAGMQERLRGSLNILPANAAPVMLDGFMINYDSVHYADGIDANDIPKMLNTGENAGISSQDQLLIVERRSRVRDHDTMHIKLSNLRVQSYQWELQANNMDYPGRTAFLVDRYTNTSTPLNMAGNTSYYFNVENVSESAAAERFIIVFRQPDNNPLPVTIVAVSAIRKEDKTVVLHWEVENEINISSYEEERSADGMRFTGIHTRLAPANSGGRAAYNDIDLLPGAGDQFYRIKATGRSGQVQYSAIVKVAAIKQRPSISIYPNPVEGRDLQLRFVGQPAGKYSLQVSNAAGQVIYWSAVTVSSALQTYPISLPANTAAGAYQLKVEGADGAATVEKLLLK